MTMQPVLYLDCSAGIAGDMFVAALVDAGVAQEALLTEIGKLGLDCAIRFEEGSSSGCRGLRLRIGTGEEERRAHRRLADILALISGKGLPPAVEARADSMFRRICETEGRIHGMPADEVHLHEVGALDSIVDIVAACVCLHLLAPGVVIASPVETGSGFVETRHGRMPIPAPATASLLSGIPSFQSGIAGECCTPTGALILREICDSFGPQPLMMVGSIGYGLGTRETRGHVNAVRAFVGQRDAASETSVVSIECNVDDSTPEVLGWAMDRLYETGALEVTFQPLQMKKNRPGVLIRVLARRESLEDISGVLTRETSTIGVRWVEMNRRELPRRIVELDTSLGNILFKEVTRGETRELVPEMESCAAVARQKGMPLREVMRLAIARAAQISKR